MGDTSGNDAEANRANDPSRGDRPFTGELPSVTVRGTGGEREVKLRQLGLDAMNKAAVILDGVLDRMQPDIAAWARGEANVWTFATRFFASALAHEYDRLVEFLSMATGESEERLKDADLWPMDSFSDLTDALARHPALQGFFKRSSKAIAEAVGSLFASATSSSSEESTGSEDATAGSEATS